jgi:opacity protein-like surface antigen
VRRIAGLFAALVGASVPWSGALAADMKQDWPAAPPPVIKPLQPLPDMTGSWYLRGDLGVRWPFAGGADAAGNNAAPSVTLSNVFWGGIGAGFKNNAVRVDGTLEYGGPSTYRGTAVSTDDSTAKVQALTAMLNAYYDIGTWAGLTPYVGVGLGTAYLRVSDYQSATTPPLSPVGSFGRWNMAYGAMAGASYQIAHSLAVDVGYRYLGLGTAETKADATGALTIRKVSAHELRVGLRWMFGGSGFPSP